MQPGAVQLPKRRRPVEAGCDFTLRRRVTLPDRQHREAHGQEQGGGGLGDDTPDAKPKRSFGLRYVGAARVSGFKKKMLG